MPLEEGAIGQDLEIFQALKGKERFPLWSH